MNRKNATAYGLLTLLFCLPLPASASLKIGGPGKKGKEPPADTVRISRPPKPSASAVPTLYRETDRRRDSLFLEATASYIVSRPDEALEVYLHLIEQHPDHATAAFQISNLLAGKQRFSEALVYAEKACRIEPENEWFQLLLAQLYKTNRQFKKAASVFEKLQMLRPDNLNYAYERANMFVMVGDLPSAISVYDGLQNRLGHSDTWTMQKYKMYMSTGDLKSARKEIESISAAMPGQAKYLEMLAQIAMKDKDYKQAYRYLKQILEIKPDDPYIHISLADYYRNTGDFNRAYQSLEKAVENPHLEFKTKLNVLQAYYTGQENLKPKGDLLAQARSLFQTLTRVHPNEPEGFFNYGKFLLFLGDAPEAIPAFERAIALDPAVYGSWELLMFAANQLADTALLTRTGIDAAERFPEQAAPYMYIAISALLQEHFEEAVAAAVECRKRNLSNNPYIEKVSLQILGDGYFALNEYEKSLAAYESLFKLDPTDKYVRNNYAYYLTLSGTRLEEAEKLAETLCKEDPDNATFLDTYAWALYRLGKYEKARDIIKRALENGAEKDPTVLEHYGDILYKTGNKEKALEYWRKALRQSVQPNTSLERKIANPDTWKD